MDKSERDNIIKKFNDFKKSGKRISLGDILSDEQKKELNDETSHNTQNTSDKSHGSKLISKYLSEVSKFTKEVEILDEYSFNFEYNNKRYFIAYDFDSECVIFNEGQKMNPEKCREISIGEIKDIFTKK